MKVEKQAVAGTVESGDVMIMLKPDKGITIDLKSSVIKQYGSRIRLLVEQLIQQHKVTDVHISINDQGALDYVIKSRLLTALSRAFDEFNIEWGGKDR